MEIRFRGSEWLIRLLKAAAIGMLLIIMFFPRGHVDFPRTPATDALSEIKNAETALTGMMADSQCDLGCLFNPDGVTALRADLMQREGLNAFEASVRIYSTVFAALLEHGKNAQTALEERDGIDHIFDPEALGRLGSSYMELGEDPWRQPYQYFLGPWRTDWGPAVFRIYQNSVEGVSPDSLTITLAEGAQVEFPAPTTLPVYIWSLGASGVSDQAHFDPTGEYAAPARSHYRGDAAERDLGGGDDISNWDLEQSWHVLYPKSRKGFGCRG